ncbi:MAG: chorismate mutase [Flavobacteriales bacterium]
MRPDLFDSLIAGPCSAETHAQVLQTAEGLKDLPLSYFRAGIWKPRTQPGAFEGIGDIGLKWLVEVRKQYGFKICTEVATAEHVKAAAAEQIDMLWIGARSTVNPFTVQELAEALQHTGIPVMVKNPINPDLKLWLGAIERLERHNVKVIGAIHRGFSVYQKTKYRNNPHWQIAIDLKQARPDIPLIMDPSHIGGRAALIAPLAQQALDLHYNGLMIETHHDPSVALTDAKQQLTPGALTELLLNLKPRSQNERAQNELAELRDKLSLIDEGLLELLQERMELSRQIGVFKRNHNSPILQVQRWEETLKTTIEKALNAGLSPEFAEHFIKMLHEESIRIQLALLSDQPDAH